MDIIITGRHLEVSDAIRQYTSEKVGKLPRYFDRVLEIEVVADKGENHSFAVEVIVHVEHHEPFVAKHRAEDLYACIDAATDKMERQLTDHKNKLNDRKRSATH